MGSEAGGVFFQNVRNKNIYSYASGTNLVTEMHDKGGSRELLRS